jgi:chromosome segregation ATPase
MVSPPAEPGATADHGSPEAGSTRKLLLDEMQAERERAPLPPAPVLTLQPVPVDAAPVGAGRRGAMKRLAEVEALARTNLRAAEEARRVLEAERALLEEEADARTRAERTASGLRRELDRLRSTEEQRAAQARFAATSQARTELETEMERVHDEHRSVVEELDRMRGTLFDHDSLLDEYSQRLHDEQEAQAKARSDLARAEEAQRAAERKLEISLETARRRAEDDHARLVKVEEELRDTAVERDRATAELRAITEGDGELVRLRAEATSTHEDMTRLLADLDVQAARADKAEAELATARETSSQAERLAAEATEARDLAGIDLETTRRELAERNELLDAERTESQTRIADLNAQLATTTRNAESATERVADLEAQLAAAVALRDDASTHAAESAEKLEHAATDVDQLRQHAVTIGDELASTHAALEQSNREHEETRRQLEHARRDLERAYREADEAKRAAGQPVVDRDVAVEIDQIDRVKIEPIEVEPVEATSVEPPTHEPAPLTPRIQGTFRSRSHASRPAASAVDATIAGASAAKTKPTGEETPAAPVTTFRTVDSGVKRKGAGGPEVEREAALVRHLAPVDPEPPASADASGDEVLDDDAAAAEPAPIPAWRRTAMAELTALAADSDDLTPRRRR